MINLPELVKSKIYKYIHQPFMIKLNKEYHDNFKLIEEIHHYGLYDHTLRKYPYKYYEVQYLLVIKPKLKIMRRHPPGKRNTWTSMLGPDCADEEIFGWDIKKIEWTYRLIFGSFDTRDGLIRPIRKKYDLDDTDKRPIPPLISKNY